MVELLESVMIYLKDELGDGSNLDKLDTRSVSLVASSIRLLMCWLSHESLLEKEILELMPRFIRFAEHVDKSTAVEMVSSADLFSFLSAGVQRIYLNLKAKFDLKKSRTAAGGGQKLLPNDAKSEFEIFELSQEMDRVKTILDKCHEHKNKNST